jgi:hypothetical protein
VTGPAVVYRTTHPDTIATYREACEERASWGDRVVAFAKSVNGGNAYTTTGFGRERFVGIEVKGDPPEGWRIQTNKHGQQYLVPRRSTKAGKEAAKAFDALQYAPSAKDVLNGMPAGFLSGAEGGIAFFSPGARIDGDVLTVLWGAELPKGEAERVGPQWERIPLSTYYADVEARAATS